MSNDSAEVLGGRQLRIVHTDGPLADDPELREVTFPDDAREILIGTLARATVRYPASEASVCREHLVLQRDAGRYELRVSTDAPVYLNGRLAMDGEELKEDDHVALGDRKGPGFVVRYTGDDGDLASRRGARQRDDTHYIRRGWFALHVMGTVIVLGGLALLGYIVHLQARQQRIETQTAAWLEELGGKAGHGSFVRAIDTALNSLYLIAISSERGVRHLGTAWSVGNGLLATNAHVAEALDEIRNRNSPPARILAKPVDPALPEAPILGMLIHPGYDIFATTWEEYKPVESGLSSLVDVRPITAYDVALLETEPGVLIAPALTLADKATLASLRPGTPVAYVGFPMQGVSLSSLDVPVPVSQTGVISSLTNFTRTISFDARGAELIVHSLPGAGGASGSPIFTRDGTVVGLFNVVTVAAAGSSIPSAVAINYAQSVAVLRELLPESPPLDASRLHDRIVAELAAHFKPLTPELALGETIEHWRAQRAGGRTDVIFESNLAIDGSERVGKIAATITERELDAGRYFAWAISSTARDIDLWALAVTEDDGNLAPVGLDEEMDSFPLFEFELERGTKVHLVATDGAFDDDGVSRSTLRLGLLRAQPE